MFSFRSKPKPKPMPKFQDMSTPPSNATGVTNSSPITSQEDYVDTQYAGNNWYCSLCTFENESGSVACMICHTEQPQTVLPYANGNNPKTLTGTVEYEIGSRHKGLNFEQVPQQIALLPEKCRLELTKHLSEDITMQTVVVFADGTSVENTSSMKSEDLLRLLSTGSKTSNELISSPNSSITDSKYDSHLGLSGVPNVYKESTANAGLAGGERVRPPNIDGKAIDNSKKQEPTPDRSTLKNSKSRKVGAPQFPQREEITLQERNAQLVDGGLSLHDL